MLSTTKHKLTTYELDIIRISLRKAAVRFTNEQDKMTAWMLYDRLHREALDQRKQNENQV